MGAQIQGIFFWGFLLLFGAGLADWVTERMRDKGVNILFEQRCMLDNEKK